MEKVQWNSINRKQNGLKQSKNEKSSILPREPELWLAGFRDRGGLGKSVTQLWLQPKILTQGYRWLKEKHIRLNVLTKNSCYTLSGRTGSALVWQSEGCTFVADSVQQVMWFAAQPALQCAIRGAQWVLPCVGWGVRPVNWIYRLWRHCP